MRVVPSLLLSNPLGADDAQRIGLETREYAVGEVIAVNDFVFVTLLRTGYGLPYGAVTDILLIGEGSPTEAVGADGQWYLDSLNEVLWGPKIGGLWPSDPIRPDRGVQQLQIVGDQLQVTYSTGTTALLGRIRVVWRGPWVTATVYAVDDIVTSDAATFRVRAAHTATTAPTRTTPGADYELLLSAPDATAGTKGSLRLTGDLGGTADSPTVPAVQSATSLPTGTTLVRRDAAGRFRAAAPADDADVARKVDVDARIPLTQRGAANGVATLDAGGLVPTSQIPPVALVKVTPVADQAAMLALAAEPGDVAVRADGTGTWMLRIAPATSPGNWTLLASPTDAVTSVDGLVGAVSLGSTTATASSLARRDAAGRLAVAAGSAAGDAVNVGQTTAFGRDRGAGVTLPSTDLRRGDVYDHTALGLHVYTGTRWALADLHTPAMEGSAVYAYGHSYVASDTNGLAAPQRYIYRVGDRLDVDVVNRATGGYKMADVAFDAIGGRFAHRGWVIGTKGAVVVDATINDVNVNGSGAAALNSYRNALRAFCEFVSAGTIVDSEASGWTYTATSALNTHVDAFGGQFRSFASGTAATATRAFTGTEITVALLGVADTVARSVDILVDGVVKATVPVHGQTVATNFYGASGLDSRSYIHVTRRITGLSAGNHTLLLRPAGGGNAAGEWYFDWYSQRSATPPPIFVVKCVDTADTSKDVAIDAYNAIIDEIALEFPNLTVVDPTVGWDRATMVGADNLHLNARGNAHIAAVLTRAMAQLDFGPALEGGVRRLPVMPPKPIFQSAWGLTLSSCYGSWGPNWGHWDPPSFELVRVSRDDQGLCTMTGLGKNVAATVGGELVMTLPREFWPRAKQESWVFAGSGPTLARVDIDVNGNMIYAHGVMLGAGQFVDFSQIQWRAADSNLSTIT